MTINTSTQAQAESLGQLTNTPGSCQLVTRGWFDAPSAGDQDHDGDADAIDGWLSEPVDARRYDRTPPLGKPLAFRNASRNGFGHRALSLAEGGVRSTDFSTATQRYKAGVVGTANSIATLERAFGLVYLGWSQTIDGFPIPADPRPPVQPKFVHRKFGHLSLQFSDNDRQHTADLEKLFHLGLDAFTGTEAHPSSGNNPKELKRCAKKYGYRLSITNKYDGWVAIKEDHIIPGSFTKGSVFVYPSSAAIEPKPKGHWSPRGIVWAKYEDKECGMMSFGVVHQLTPVSRALKKKVDAIHAKKMDAWGTNHGGHEKLAFMDGDFNSVDRLVDVYGRAPFTTCWDELKVWPGTGHGNIDAIGSWDADGRVECISARARDDSDFFLNTDHFLITANYEIRLLVP